MTISASVVWWAKDKNNKILINDRARLFQVPEKNGEFGFLFGVSKVEGQGGNWLGTLFFFSVSSFLPPCKKHDVTKSKQRWSGMGEQRTGSKKQEQSKPASTFCSSSFTSLA